MSALATIVTPDGVDTCKLLEPAIQLVAALGSDVAAAVEFTAGGGVLGLLAILSDTAHRVSFQSPSTAFPVHTTMACPECGCMPVLPMPACQEHALPATAGLCNAEQWPQWSALGILRTLSAKQLSIAMALCRAPCQCTRPR